MEVRGRSRCHHRPAGHSIAAIVEFVTTTLPNDPHRLSKPLRFELAGWRVARRGDYRVTFRLLEDDRVLYIGRIEHRAHVYRRQ
jgi:mRNA interferase RelE/StbE